MKHLLAAAALLACAAPTSGPGTGQGQMPAVAAPPPGCAQVAPGAQLQPLLDAAPDGAAFCLTAGEYAGPVRLTRGQALYGPRAAILRSAGQGTTVRISGKGTRLIGVTVAGSGGRYDRMDAGVQAEGEDVLIEGVAIRDGVFGVVIDRSQRAVLRRSEILGSGGAAIGLRGDAVRLWEATDARIEDNLIQGGRDVVARYSTRPQVLRNTISDCRYGLHLMYSHGARIEGNRSVGNVVGAFVMYSRDAQVRGNLLGGASGGAGIGLGLKESGNVTAVGNAILRNTTGLYLDTSPLYLGDGNHFQDNVLRLNEVAVLFHSSPRRNTFLGNSLRDNRAQVRVEGGGDAMGITWQGNDFDDYVGYDLDRDGTGDLPYELRSLSADLLSRYPDLGFFRGAPALWLVDAIAHIAPIFAPRLILRDPRPRLEPPPLPRLEGGHAG